MCKPFVDIASQPAGLNDLLIKEIAVKRDKHAHKPHDPVMHGDIIAWAGLERRIGHEGQEDGECEVDLA